MFEIRLSFLQQFEDTTELGDDEPYVVVFAADLADTAFIPIPGAASTLYGPFDIDNVVGFPVNGPLCWGFDGKPRDIDDADNPLILVALMESDHDDSPANFANSVRTAAHAQTFAALIGYVAARNHGKMDLDAIRSRLISDMQGGLDLAKSADIEHDERLGRVQRLPITLSDLQQAQKGAVKKTLTFVSGEEDSKYTLTFSITAGVGSASSALTTNGPTDRYAAIWRKDSGATWTARHRMTSTEYQQEFQKQTALGLRLVHISGYSFAGEPHFAAVWMKTNGPEWIAQHNMTSGVYQQELNKQQAMGFRPVQVSAYRGHGADLYAAIWSREPGVSWTGRHRMTANSYQSEFAKLAATGFRLACVSGYRIGEDERFAAIWEQTTGPIRVARHGMTAAEYQKEFDKLRKDGFHLIHVCGCQTSSATRFAGIWEKSAVPEWVARHDLTADQYQAEFTGLGKKGYRLVCVSGY